VRDGLRERSEVRVARVRRSDAWSAITPLPHGRELREYLYRARERVERVERQQGRLQAFRGVTFSIAGMPSVLTPSSVWTVATYCLLVCLRC
jgi:hypothetical protein